jgi:GNAT superfamily N-acetyltransferase
MKKVMLDFKIIKIKTNAQNLYGWLALTNTDQPVGHIFMQIEIDNKIKFMDAWVSDEFRRQGIFSALWEKRWEYVKKNFNGWTAYAWSLPMSINLLRKKGFDEGDTCVYMEKTINENE